MSFFFFFLFPSIRMDCSKRQAANEWLTEYSGMQHSACVEELNDVEAFLQSRLPPQDK